MVIELERFFLQHCDTLQEYYLEYDNLSTLPGPLSLLRLCLHQTALAMRGGCAALDASGGVVAALGRLCDQTDTLYLAREQACIDCRLMRDNASAKSARGGAPQRQHAARLLPRRGSISPRPTLLLPPPPPPRPRWRPSFE